MDYRSAVEDAIESVEELLAAAKTSGKIDLKEYDERAGHILALGHEGLDSGKRKLVDEVIEPVTKKLWDIGWTDKTICDNIDTRHKEVSAFSYRVRLHRLGKSRSFWEEAVKRGMAWCMAAEGNLATPLALIHGYEQVGRHELTNGSWPYPTIMHIYKKGEDFLASELSWAEATRSAEVFVFGSHVAPEVKKFGVTQPVPFPANYTTVPEWIDENLEPARDQDLHEPLRGKRLNWLDPKKAGEEIMNYDKSADPEMRKLAALLATGATRRSSR